MISRTFRHSFRAAAAALVLLTAACPGDSTGPSPKDGGTPGTVAGVFKLATVNGAAPSTPWSTFEIEPGTVARHFVTTARIDIRPDSTITVRETHRLVITGRLNRDMAQEVVKQGTFSFEPSEPGADDNGRIHVTFDSGGTRTMDLTQITITDVRMVPGNPGEGDVPLQLIYTRE